VQVRRRALDVQLVCEHGVPGRDGEVPEDQLVVVTELGRFDGCNLQLPAQLVPRASTTMQPTHWMAFVPLSPSHYLIQHLFPSSLMTYGHMLSLALTGIIRSVLIDMILQQVERRCWQSTTGVSIETLGRI
jgi:hypothetical protein